MSFLPSIRELLERHRELCKATPTVAASLRALKMPESASMLEQMTDLAAHMATYLRHGGTVVIKPPPPPPKVPGVSVLPPTPPITIPHAAPCPPAPPSSIPPGLIGREEILREIGHTSSWLSAAITAGKFPQPTERSGRLKLWRRAAVAADIARLRTNQGAE